MGVTFVPLHISLLSVLPLRFPVPPLRPPFPPKKNLDSHSVITRPPLPKTNVCSPPSLSPFSPPEENQRKVPSQCNSADGCREDC